MRLPPSRDHELRTRVVDARPEARGANPPNTTEWIAPILAQARMTTRPPSGYVDDDPVAFADSSGASSARGAAFEVDSR